MAKWVFQIDLNGYQNASQIWFEDGFKILGLDIFRHYNEFSWNGYCASFIRPDVSRPQFNFFFCFLGGQIFNLKKNLLAYRTQKLLEWTSFLIIETLWLVFEAFLQICKFTNNSLFIGVARTQKLVEVTKNIISGYQNHL